MEPNHNDKQKISKENENALNSYLKGVQNQEEIRSKLHEHFINKEFSGTFPKYPLPHEYYLKPPLPGFYIIKDKTGLGGGKSFKLENIYPNWKKILFDNLFQGVTSIGGAIASPYLIPFAALGVAKVIFDKREISIGERHSIVIVKLWELSDGNTNNIEGHF